MARFNTTAVKKTARRPDKVNLAGGNAFSQSAKSQLVHTLLTSFVKDQFYRSADQGIADVRNLVASVDPQFAAKAAIYARNEFGMRSVSHIVASEVPVHVKGEKWTKNFIDKVVRRPDDATEILSLYLATHGKPVPNSLKKGLGLALGKFDAYQLAKYRGDGKGVSLIDVVNLVHVKPNAKNREALEQLVDGTLKSTGTWESKLSEAGKSEDKAEAKTQAWKELIESGKIGYFAALRNIRNVSQQAPEMLGELMYMICDPAQVKKSLVLPFRYITALDEIEKAGLSTTHMNLVRKGLNKALEASFDNAPKFDGNTLVAIDRSGSMTGWGSARATIDYAVVFAAALMKGSDADLMLYDSTAQYFNRVNPDDTFTTILKTIRSQCNGGATNVSAVFHEANKKYDRIVILSDNESWLDRGWYGHGSAADAKAQHQPQAFVYAMDLAGYGDLQFPESDRKVANIAGFSEKVFDMFKLLEQDPDALVKKIEAVEL